MLQECKETSAGMLIRDQDTGIRIYQTISTFFLCTIPADKKKIADLFTKQVTGLAHQVIGSASWFSVQQVFYHAAYQPCDCRSSSKARGFDADEIDQARNVVSGFVRDHEISHRLPGPLELRPDTAISGRKASFSSPLMILLAASKKRFPLAGSTEYAIASAPLRCITVHGSHFFCTVHF